MDDPRKMTAKDIRDRIEQLDYDIDMAQNEQEEYARELQRRGLKI